MRDYLRGSSIATRSTELLKVLIYCHEFFCGKKKLPSRLIYCNAFYRIFKSFARFTLDRRTEIHLQNHLHLFVCVFRVTFFFSKGHTHIHIHTHDFHTSFIHTTSMISCMHACASVKISCPNRARGHVACVVLISS